MNFSTTTKSGVIQYAKKDPTKVLNVPEVEHNIIERFNKKFSSQGITVQKFNEHLPLAFMVVANSSYDTVLSVKDKHPEYSELVISMAYLDGCADHFELKCTRNGSWYERN
jgi:hypothetical protein